MKYTFVSQVILKNSPYPRTRLTSIYEEKSEVQKLVITSNIFKEYNR